MLSLLKRGRRAAAVVGGAALAGSLALATPAFAGSNAPTAKNNMIIGSGSATTYSVMTALGDLFNSFPGCNIIAASGSQQPLDYSCVPPANPATAGYGENPLNDVALEEPPFGSSNGITQLEDQLNPSPPVGVAPANFARSSRAIKPGSDDAGLNFVAYAADGVSWFHFSKVDGAPTASASVTNLTSQQLQNIANGTTTNWSQVGGKPDPIIVFAAQAGSGTESTWESAVGTNWSVEAAKGSDHGTTDHIILENEDRQMIQVMNETPTSTKYIGDVIFLFSYGKFTVSCRTVCGGTPVPGTTSAKPTIAALGKINGVAPTVATILNHSFPVPRLIYNVYANSHAGADSPKLAPATQATLNFVSEAGFLCKPNAVVDPVTGMNVRKEIDSVISGQGFIPLPPVSNEDTGVNYPAVMTAPYSKWDNLPNKGGFCVTSTTG